MIRSHFWAALLGVGLTLAGCTQNASSPSENDPQNTALSSDYNPDYATAPLDLSTPERTAYAVMIAMYRGDVEMIDQVFAPEGVLRRLSPTGEISPNGLEPWRDWVATLSPGQAHEELFDIQVEQFDRLATVWAPFVIRLNDEIVGCGVNQFTMANQSADDAPAEWRIIAGIDVQAPKERCAGFRESYRDKDTL